MITIIFLGFLLAVMYYVRKFHLVYTTSDIKILGDYAYWYPFSKFVRRKLQILCSKQIEQSINPSEVAKILQFLGNFGGDFPDLCTNAWHKHTDLCFAEGQSEVENAKGDEDRLLQLLWFHSSGGGFPKLAAEIKKALHSFTGKRICEAVTLEDLIYLDGGKKYLGHLFFADSSRVDDSLKNLYSLTLNKFVLRDALAASDVKNVNDLCFQYTTGDHSIDVLVAMKRASLGLSTQINSIFPMEVLRKEIDFALKSFLNRL